LRELWRSSWACRRRRPEADWLAYAESVSILRAVHSAAHTMSRHAATVLHHGFMRRNHPALSKIGHFRGVLLKGFDGCRISRSLDDDDSFLGCLMSRHWRRPRPRSSRSRCGIGHAHEVDEERHRQKSIPRRRLDRAKSRRAIPTPVRSRLAPKTGPSRIASNRPHARPVRRVSSHPRRTCSCSMVRA
jgi:hypothetical protein